MADQKQNFKAPEVKKDVLKKVKVKILRSCGQWNEGEIVEVDEATAKIICEKTVINWGSYEEIHQKAMLEGDYIEMTEGIPDIENMTVDELAARGYKNVEGKPVKIEAQKK